MSEANQQQEEKQVVDYILHDNGIHEFIFYESSRKAVDAWITKTEEITAASEATPDQTVRYLYNQVTSGMQPANYAFRRSQDMIKKYPKRARSRTVFLTNPGFFVSLMDAFVKLLRTEDKDRVQFINGDKRDEAIAWLLSDS